MLTYKLSDIFEFLIWEESDLVESVDELGDTVYVIDKRVK